MLQITNLSKSYQSDRKAVDNLSLTVEAGDLLGFIGHNGAGKTTTLKCVAGILNFEAGDITIAGKSVTRQPLECKRLTAYLPDNPDLYEYLTGIQYLGSSPMCSGFPGPTASRPSNATAICSS